MARFPALLAPIALGVTLVAGSASALNQISLQPGTVNLQPAASTALALRVAFDQQALGGGIVIELDPGVAAFAGFSFAPGFPDDPSLRLVCPSAADPRCTDFDDGDGQRMLIAFGAVLTPPTCSPGLAGSLEVGSLTLAAVSLGQTAVTLREDDGVAGGFVGCVGVSFDAPSFAGTTVTVADLADADGDGLPDVGDRCPRFATTDNTDSDGNGRGDPCECGDASGDGVVTVSDIVAVNRRIFTPNPSTPLCGPGVASPCNLCDADGNHLCNVSDIVAVNREIFSAGPTSSCARSPAP